MATEQYGRMRRLVGLVVATDTFVAVEDRASREFARLLIARTDNTLSVRAEIMDAKSESDITKLRQLIPRRLRSLSVVGAYDGDMKEKIAELDEEKKKQEWPFIFLPGTMAVEEIFQQLAKESPALFAEKLGRTQDDFEVALASMQGKDHHDWLEELAKLLGVNYDQLMLAGFECWYSSETGKAHANVFVDQLKAAINSVQ